MLVMVFSSDYLCLLGGHAFKSNLIAESSVLTKKLAGSPSLGFVPASPGLGYAPGSGRNSFAGSPYNSYAAAGGAMPSFSLDASLPPHEMTKVRLDAYFLQ